MGDLRATGDVVDGHEGDAEANVGANGYGAGKADLASAVVDAHRDARDPEHLRRELWAERQSEVTVSDRGTEWASCSTFDIDVNPLVIACCFGEFLDLFLGDLGVRGPAEVLADEGLHLIDAVDRARHVIEPGTLTM